MAHTEDDIAAEQSLAAFEAEALPHMNDLFRAAARLLQDQNRASDAVQETFLIAWKSFGKYRRGSNCRAWLFEILFNVVRHERRNWLKWITGREDDIAETQLSAPAPIREDLTDSNILTAMAIMSRLSRARGILRGQLTDVAHSHGTLTAGAKR